MGNSKSYEGRFGNVLHQLSESVLEESDEGIVAEIREAGANPKERAEHIRALLRRTVALFDAVNRRLWALDHTVDPGQWRRGEHGYYVSCQSCGQIVRFSISAGEMQGDALVESCPKRDKCRVARTANI